MKNIGSEARENVHSNYRQKTGGAKARVGVSVNLPLESIPRESPRIHYKTVKY